MTIATPMNLGETRSMTGCCPGTLALSSKSLKIANPKVSRLVESEMKSSRLMEEFYDRGNKKKGETGILHKVKGFIKKRW
jgi:hypothetical protein